MSKEYQHQYSIRQLQQPNQTHPFQQLSNLNKIFNNYNKTPLKNYSSTSKIKLPFKKFNNIKIPQCFQQSYKKQKKIFNNLNILTQMKQDDLQRKLWKQHKQIIKKYIQNKKNKERKVKRVCGQQILKDRNNLFLKKIIQKGSDFTYDHGKLQQEVLTKLKNLNRPRYKRNNNVKSVVINQQKEEVREVVDRQGIREDEYLRVEGQEELIRKYKGVIRYVDYSISSKNIQKTTKLLEQMQRMVERQDQAKQEQEQQ